MKGLLVALIVLTPLVAQAQRRRAPEEPPPITAELSPVAGHPYLFVLQLALASDRAYRKGWAPDMALAHIRDAAGTHFDAQVVDALVRLVGGWGIDQAQQAGAATVAWQAAETCHEIDDESLVPA